jgi:NAD-dependent dihydropyrimidine dehydrogenase PreA subunit
MTTTKRRARGMVELDREECKGCGLCVDACPPGGLHLSGDLNHYGVHPVFFDESAECTGCGICFFVCPEPGAITVYREAPEEVGASPLTTAA